MPRIFDAGIFFENFPRSQYLILWMHARHGISSAQNALLIRPRHGHSKFSNEAARNNATCVARPGARPRDFWYFLAPAQASCNPLKRFGLASPPPLIWTSWIHPVCSFFLNKTTRQWFSWFRYVSQLRLPFEKFAQNSLYDFFFFFFFGKFDVQTFTLSPTSENIKQKEGDGPDSVWCKRSRANVISKSIN